MISNIKIALWNANGLHHHILELKTFLISHDIDVMLISETHFTQKSFLNINNYNNYTTNHPAGSARGGTAILIKKEIKHTALDEYREKNIQSTAIKIEGKDGSIAIASIYCPPSCTTTKEHFTKFFQTLGSSFLVGGDFNAKHQQWGSRLTNTRGRELFKTIKAANLTHLSTGEPTYWPSDPGKTPDLIDFCVTKNVNKNQCTISSCLELSSDHSPVIVTLQSEVKETEPSLKLHTNKTDWTLFRDICVTRLNLNIPLKTNEDIEEATHRFISLIQLAAWESTPKIRVFVRKNRVNSEVKKLINEKRKLRRNWQRTRHPNDRALLNKAIRHLKQTLAMQSNEELDHFLSNLSPYENSNYSLWKATRNLDKKTIRIPPIKKDGKWGKTDKEKAELFATHLSDVFQPFSSNYNDKDVSEFLSSPGQMDFPIKSTTNKEIKKLIKQFPNKKKTPGFDLITSKTFKELPLKAITQLRNIINAMFRVGYFPVQLKVAQIIMIPKPGKPLEDVKSYRPISLLPFLSKIIEKLLLSRLKPILHAKHLIPDHQFGFREHHATTEQVHRTVQIIRSAFERKQYCSATFLDITQAFDKVWHSGLMYKLKKLLPYPFYELLKSYLESRYFFVKFREQQSGLHSILSGVPQGSVLGPLLYTLFTSDLPTCRNTEIATFADDTVILSTNEDPVIASMHLQTHLNKIHDWFQAWRMKANASKSVHVTFTLRTRTCPKVCLGNEELPQADTTKYLGIHLDRRLTWQKHILMKRKQLGIKLTSMYWLIGRNSKLSIDNKLLIYKTIVKPIWTYGSELWGSAAKTNVEVIQRFQSKFLRTIANAPKFVTNKTLHRDFHILTVGEEIIEINNRYSKRLSAHTNILAFNLLQIPSQQRRLRRFPLTHLVVTR